MAERYDVAKHGGRKWDEYNPTLHPSWPEKAGYYTVVVTRRNHWWVEAGYYWTGDAWVTAHNSPCSNVIRYDTATCSQEKPGVQK